MGAKISPCNISLLQTHNSTTAVARLLLLTTTSNTWHRVLAHLSKSNSRTFQGLSRTIRRIYEEN